MVDKENRRSISKALRKNAVYIAVAAFLISFYIYSITDNDRNRQKYMIDGECRYTIGIYEKTIRGNRRDWDYFKYTINGRVRYEHGPDILHKYRHVKRDDLRFLIRYNIKNPDEADIQKILVPDWVRAAPINGWAMFPPDINWAGAVVDSADMVHWRAYKRVGLGRTEPSPWVMDIPDIVLTQLLPEHKRVSETNFSLRFPENYHAVSRPSHSLSSTFIRNDSMAHIRIATYPDLDYSALLKEVADRRALDTICDNCYYEQSFTLNNHPADFLHYFDPSTERNYMYLFFNDDDKQAVMIDADYSPGVWNLKQEVRDILFSISK